LYKSLIKAGACIAIKYLPIISSTIYNLSNTKITNMVVMFLNASEHVYTPLALTLFEFIKKWFELLN
jgi:hypothetical protein